MHIVNTCAYNIQHTDNNKQWQKCKVSLDKFLSASAWSSLVLCDNFCRKHCLLTSLLMCCSSHLHGRQFPSILNKTTYFHMRISISEFVIPLCCRYQVVLHLAPVRNTVKICNSWLLPHITMQPLVVNF